MKKYWRIFQDSGKYKSPYSLGKNYLSIDLVRSFESFSTDGMKLKFARSGPREGRVIGDFTHWNVCSLTPSKKAFNCLRSFLEASGRKFDINIGALPYVIVLINQKYEAFDYVRSRYSTRGLTAEEFTGHSAPLPSGGKLKITQIALNPDFTTEAHLFRLAGEHLLELEIIASEDFRQAYLSHKLTGLHFSEVIL